MTRAELCRLLGIAHQTLDRWMLTGRISKGRKVFYNRVFTKADVLKALHLPPAKPELATAGKR